MQIGFNEPLGQIKIHGFKSRHIWKVRAYLSLYSFQDVDNKTARRDFDHYRTSFFAIRRGFKETFKQIQIHGFKSRHIWKMRAYLSL